MSEGIMSWIRNTNTLMYPMICCFTEMFANVEWHITSQYEDVLAIHGLGKYIY